MSYLYGALKAKGLQTFLDRKSLGTGENAWGSIENAIKNCRIAVVVFSERYTESPWCLKELEVILDTRSIKVVPIFYNVRPSELRHPKIGALGDGFEKSGRGHDGATIERWKKRLKEASEIVGCEHPCDSTRQECLKTLYIVVSFVQLDLSVEIVDEVVFIC